MIKFEITVNDKHIGYIVARNIKELLKSLVPNDPMTTYEYRVSLNIDSPMGTGEYTRSEKIIHDRRNNVLVLLRRILEDIPISQENRGEPNNGI